MLYLFLFFISFTESQAEVNECHEKILRIMKQNDNTSEKSRLVQQPTNHDSINKTNDNVDPIVKIPFSMIHNARPLIDLLVKIFFPFRKCYHIFTPLMSFYYFMFSIQFWN